MDAVRNFSLGRSAGMLAVIYQLEALAPSISPVLFEGEPGTGKSAIARLMHDRSLRTGPWVHESLPALDDSLQRDTLFGHVRGAFTGAVGHRIGLIEAAHNGTLFLDELGDATAGSQATLLRILDAGIIRRLGEEKERYVSVRVLSATNANLEERVAKGTFRKDLLDRIGSFRIWLPPLRERREEILPLFLSFLIEELLRLGDQAAASFELAEDTKALLYAAPWPGNVRQLRKEAEYAACFARGSEIVRPEHLSPTLQADADTAVSGCSLTIARRRARRRLEFLAVLVAEGGSMARAAERLQLGERRAYRTVAMPRPESVQERRGRRRKAI
jgi:two-component system, NtrC family, response regulator HydG